MKKINQISQINQINQVKLGQSKPTQPRPPINSTNQAKMPESSASDDSIPATPATTLANPRPHAVMPRPDQLGSMLFDGNNISDFLEDWNIECEDYGLTGHQNCSR